MAIKPIGDRLLVAPIKTEEITKSGIILPETAQEKKAEGLIMALGSGEKISRLGLSVNQKVIYSRYAGDEIKEDGQDYKIISHDDVLAVIE